MALSPTEGFNFFANVGYQNGKYTFLDPASQAATTGATDLPLLSEWTVQARINYEDKVSDDIVMRWGLGAAYIGDAFVEVTNSLQIKRYLRANSFVAVTTDDRKWGLKFQVENRTNETNYIIGFVGGSTAGFTILKPGTYLVNLSYKI